MSSNKKLAAANKAKYDEFYTQLKDIENEVRYYKDQLKDKVILCNCDDPFESNFFKYFAMNFNYFGLKKLIATCFTGSPIVGSQLSLFDVTGLLEPNCDLRNPYKIEVTEVNDENQDGATDLSDVEYLIKNKKNVLSLLKEGGDFRSDECIKLLKEADVVITNPPFSLFKEYITQLFDNNKKFIIIGNKNAITYKEVFSYIMSNRIWAGYRNFSGGMWFTVSDDYSDYDKIIDGIKYKNVPSIWFTNLDTSKRHDQLTLFKRYNSNDYPTYDNYDAIEVSKVTNIPCDYSGIMGVPITFLDKYNPEQFEILGMCENLDLYGLKTRIYTSKECKDKYHELFGKNGVYDLNAAGVVNGKKVYQRLLIRRKECK